MERQSPSIFNDIVGPIMVGPSSSHTCGPSRIGFLSQQLLETSLTKAIIEFAQDGAYANMYKGQRSDLGFINGLLGNRPEDTRLPNAYDEATLQGVTVEFLVTNFEPIVPNIAKLHLTGEGGERVEVFSDSTGGGTVKLLKIDGFEVAIVGDCYELLVRCPLALSDTVASQLRKKFENNEGFTSSEHSNEVMFNVKLRKAITEEELASIKSLHGITWVRTINPVLTVLSHRSAKLPFISAEDLARKCAETGKSLAEQGIEYEIARSGWSREAVLKQMEVVIGVMENAVSVALQGNINMNGIIEPTAGSIFSHLKTSKTAIDMGALSVAVPWSMAAMEYSSAQGVVVCAPTGGSAGVFPGAVLGTATYLNLSMAEKVEAMFVTAAIGIAMSKDHNYSAELYGCQVEPGAASAMAAGALVAMMGGTCEQSLAAASCATQNILGTICDPVAGLVQVPCISRNAMSTANALVSALIVMGGYDPLIPLDEAAETLFRVGMQLPSELRCTCMGGLCTTSCGQRLAQEQDERDNARIN